MIGSHTPDSAPHRLRVFLSGRIDGVDLQEASRWRHLATLRLGESGFDVYDPTRVMRENRGHRSIANEVFTNDRWNMGRCDLVLVNLTLPAMLRGRDVPFFTIGEMFLAHERGLPLIVFGSCLEGRPGYDAIVTRSFADLDEAISYIVATYGAACISPRSPVA